MARIIGDHTGTTWKDFIVLPGFTKESHIIDNINIETDMAGVVLRYPFMVAAMRSVVNEEMALEASKKMMAVAPRSLSIENEAAIVRYVKDNAVKSGEIESQKEPVIINHTDTLGDAIRQVHKFGHSNIPVVDLSELRRYKGMFVYEPVKHDRADSTTPITELMIPFNDNESDFCPDSMTDERIREYMVKNDKRMVPVLDSEKRLRRLVFLQREEAYKVGAAIDTFHDKPGWRERLKTLVEAGADMIVTDTADAYSQFELDAIKKYKDMFPDYPPICAGNIVTPEAFRKLADAGADIIKLGMGPGSICTTNSVLAIGAPPMWSLIEIARERGRYTEESDGRYIPLVADGGIEDTYDVAVALTHADAIMGGKLFVCFEESAGRVIEKAGVRYKEYYGEASRKAVEAAGSMERYTEDTQHVIYQGVVSHVPIKGLLKPGLEEYAKASRTTVSHVGCGDLKEYRENVCLLRLTEAARYTAGPHGVEVVD